MVRSQIYVVASLVALPPPALLTGSKRDTAMDRHVFDSK